MRSGGSSNIRLRVVVMVVAVALASAACTVASSEVEQADLAAERSPTTPDQDVVATEPPAAPQPPTPTEPAEPVPSVEVEAPPAPPERAATIDFPANTTQAISNDGVYAYAGTTLAWIDKTRCDAAPAETLAVVNIEQAAAGTVAAVGAGLEHAGDLRQLVFSTTNRAVAVWSCASGDVVEFSMQQVDFGPDGRAVELGEIIRFDRQQGEQDPFVIGWIDRDTVDVQILVEQDPEDFTSWLVDRRVVSTTTGDVVSSSQLSYDDDAAFDRSTEVTSPSGEFTYRAIDDPAGNVGCEGYGVARAIEVERQGDSRLALGEDGEVFALVADLHFAAGDYVAWTSGCEGYFTAYVGKVLPDGSITDAHYVETFDQSNGVYSDYRAFRLSNDGYLVGVGMSSAASGDEEPAFLRYELGTDPHFVNTADPAPAIEPTPLFDAANEIDTWHRGDTLGAEPACGASTLYGRSSSGFVRAFPAAIELDTIVDVDLTETERFTYDQGPDYLSRTVVVSTTCPAEYEGVRVYFGNETGNVRWGLRLDQADVAEVAEVISVRNQRAEDSDYVEAVLIEVRLLDGSVAEVPLQAIYN